MSIRIASSLLKKSVADPETREGEAPAEPLFDGLLGSAGASPSQNVHGLIEK
jgi:hypothetical protein